jgi:hypothetical protein
MPGGSDGQSDPSKNLADCDPMATGLEVMTVGAGLGATKKGKMAPNFS